MVPLSSAVQGLRGSIYAIEKYENILEGKPIKKNIFFCGQEAINFYFLLNYLVSKAGKDQSTVNNIIIPLNFFIIIKNKIRKIRRITNEIKSNQLFRIIHTNFTIPKIWLTVI